MRKNLRVRERERQRLIGLLREVRLEAGLSQTEVAARIGRDQTYVSKYESSARRLDIIEVQEICKAVGISLGEFIRRFEKASK